VREQPVPNVRTPGWVSHDVRIDLRRSAGAIWVGSNGAGLSVCDETWSRDRANGRVIEPVVSVAL